MVKYGLQAECLDLSNLQRELDFECVAVTVNRLLIMCVDRSPKGKVKEFLTNLETFIRIYGINKKDTIICGDFNIDFLESNLKNVKGKRKLCEILDEYGFKNILKNATRITSNSETLIDYMITNLREEKILAVQDNIDLALSDHSMQHVKITFAAVKDEKKFKYIRVVNESLINNFNQKLKQEPWKELEGNLDINAKFNIFHAKYKQFYDSIFILKRVNLNQKPRKRWVTTGIKISRENLKRLNLERKKSSETTIQEYFIKYRRVYRKVIRLAKKIQNDEYIQNAENKSKAAWNVVNLELGRKKYTKTEIISLYNPETGKTTKTPQEIANILNKYYRDIAKNVSKNKKREKETAAKQTWVNNSMFLYEVTEADILEAAKKLKNKKSSGPDDIYDCVVKASILNLLKPLIMLLNESFKTETFPDILKRAKIRPLFKKGDKNAPSNYRPVANISAFAKLFELVITKKIKDFLAKFLIISENQFGYQNKKSTIDALLAFVSEIYQGMSDRKFIKGFCFDLTKAFDLVNHEILYGKLETLGIRGKVLNRIKSYLRNREQFVELEVSHGEYILILNRLT